jgi:hypothetical protein
MPSFPHAHAQDQNANSYRLTMSIADLGMDYLTSQKVNITVN